MELGNPSAEGELLDEGLLKEAPSKPPSPTTSRPQTSPPPCQEAACSGTLFPQRAEDFPISLLEHFNLSNDDERYEGACVRSLVNSNDLHLSRAMAVTSRLLKHLDHTADRESEMKADIDRLNLLVEEERSLHENSKFYCEGLKKELESTQKKAFEAEKERDILQRDHYGLKGVCAELRHDLGGVVRKLESVEVKLKMFEEARVLVERDFAGYKSIGPPLTEALKWQICQEYRRSS